MLVLVVQALVAHPSVATLLAAIGLTRWPEVARLVRAEVLLVSSQDYVVAARALGAGPWRILRRHVVPNAFAPILVAATFGVASVVLVEASLDFLRAGIPAANASWGETLSETREHIGAWWLLVFPGLAVFVTVLALNLVGEALRDALDPRLRATSAARARRRRARSASPRRPPRRPRSTRRPTCEPRFVIFDHGPRRLTGGSCGSGAPLWKPPVSSLPCLACGTALARRGNCPLANCAGRVRLRATMMLGGGGTRGKGPSNGNANKGSLPYVSERDFEAQVIRSEVPVLVQFTADWCAARASRLPPRSRRSRARWRGRSTS